MTDVPEKALVETAIAGDREAVSQLLERHGEALRARLRDRIAAKWQSILDVDDILQVTFMEVFLRISKFEYRGAGAFEAWLRRIAENNLIDAVRALEAAKQLPPEKRIVFQGGGESSVALMDAIGFTSGTPSRQAVAAEAHTQLREAVSRLPRDYAQVLTLYDLEGGAAEQVAAELGRTTGAVYMLRARALDYLRESLGTAGT